MPQTWDWQVNKTNFSALDTVLKDRAKTGYEIYQIIAVQEVKPARIPYEVVVISRKAIEEAQPDSLTAFQLSYSPEEKS